MKKLIIFGVFAFTVQLTSQQFVPLRQRAAPATGVVPLDLTKYASDLRLQLDTYSPDVLTSRIITFMDTGAQSLQGLRAILNATSLDEARRIARDLYDTLSPTFKILANDMQYPSQYIEFLEKSIALQSAQYAMTGYGR